MTTIQTMTLILLVITVITVECVRGIELEQSELEKSVKSEYSKVDSEFKKLEENIKLLNIIIENDKFEMDETTVSIYQLFFSNKQVVDLKNEIKEGIANEKHWARCNHMMNQKITDTATEMSEQIFNHFRTWLKADSILDFLYSQAKNDVKGELSNGKDAVNDESSCEKSSLKCRLLGNQISNLKLLIRMLDTYKKNVEWAKFVAYQDFDNRLYEKLESLVLTPVNQCMGKTES